MPDLIDTFLMMLGWQNAATFTQLLKYIKFYISLELSDSYDSTIIMIANCN